MTVKPTGQYIDNANKVTTIAQLVYRAATLAAEVQATNSVAPMGNGWAKLGTAVISDDGSVITPDASPVSSNPVNPNLYPTLAVTLKPDQLNQLLSFALTVSTFAAGSQVNANNLAPALLAAVAPVKPVNSATGQTL